MPFVDRLLELAPQKPVENRIDYLVGAWAQVWGPYEYRVNDRSVDPTVDPDNIYQVVFPGGYYYNVGNYLDKKTKKLKRITLLRGEYKFKGGNDLAIQFTRLSRIKSLPKGLAHIDLPALAENKVLTGEFQKIRDRILVNFFPKGTLTELYTDKDLRIALGNSARQKGIEDYLYIMTRAE